MKKIKVGILTMSDGREHIHRDMLSINRKYQENLAKALEDTGEIEVIQGREIIHSNTEAKVEAERLMKEGAELTIFNYAIWCYPQYSVVASEFAPGPFILFSNLHPSKCGMVGMMAASGSLLQLNRKHFRIWGDSSDKEVMDKLLSYIKAGAAVKRLRGLTFGNFGGRPLGMYTAVANLEDWQKLFGIDVENIEQYDIVRTAETIDAKKVENALQWLKLKVGKIAFDNKALTEDKLRLQIRMYYALRKIIDDRNLDFIGIKAHGDITEYYATSDVAEAFLNDPYDFDGTHEPIVCATEADMDGALTMQIIKEITHLPVLFADVRHYDPEKKVWFFSNSGAHATYFAGKSFSPEENLKNVSFFPEVNDYPAGGASVMHFAKQGKVTLARLARINGKYKMFIVPAEIVEYKKEEMLKMSQLTTPQWPIAFTKLEVSAETFLAQFPCNHIHGTYGDFTQELINVCKILDFDYQVLKN